MLLLVGGEPLANGLHELRAGGQIPVGVRRIDVTEVVGEGRDPRIDIDARIATLADYLGHVDPSHTYWYLTASPQLMQTVRERLTAHQERVR